MKVLLLILFLIPASWVCYSQTTANTTKDSTTSSLYFNPYNVETNKFAKTFNSKFTINKTFSIYSLQNDPGYVNEMYYNNFTHSGKEMMYIYNNRFYSVTNPLQPYGNIQSSLICGTLNYLLLLVNGK